MSADAAQGQVGYPFDSPFLLQHFLDGSPQPMVAVSGFEYTVRYLNPSFATLAGKPREDMLGRPLVELISSQLYHSCQPLLDRMYQTGQPAELLAPDHSQTPPAMRSYAMWVVLGLDATPVGAMVQAIESPEQSNYIQQVQAMTEALMVTCVNQHELIDTIREGEQERHELKARMFKAQKMESLGILAGGVAHDLNNILTPVLGFTHLALNELPADSSIVPLLEEVARNAQRAADLVQQILAYSGKGRFVIEQLSLSQLVREMAKLLRSGVSSQTQLVYDLAPDLPASECDATQIRQVVMNLVSNASEAIGEQGGTITVRTGRAEPSQPPSSTPESTVNPLPKSFVFLEVEDTGCGMTPELIEKIFDPFFTTKFTGRGLGLAAVQGIARGHQGTLEVKSTPGKGSIFRLVLPSSRKPIPRPVVVPKLAGWQGSGTVLIVDDENAVRDLAAFILRKAGIKTLTADSGESGLLMFSQHQEIDAVLLDLTMPNMNGLEVTRGLHTLRPDLPIVIMSGYSVQEVALQAAPLEISAFVQKPFNVDSLLAALRKALKQ